MYSRSIASESWLYVLAKITDLPLARVSAIITYTTGILDCGYSL